MLSLYITSLNNLLVQNNPLLLLTNTLKRNVRVVWNLRRNMKLADKKHQRLQRQLQTVEAYIEAGQTNYRFSRYR